MEFKKRLAHTVTEFYHGKEAADDAAQNFVNVVQNKEVDEENMIVLMYNEVEGLQLLEILKRALKTTSSAEIKRTIVQGGVQIDNEKVTDLNQKIPVGNSIIKFGKRQYIKIELEE